MTDEVADLRRRLAEAEETLQAIRSGAVDAFVVDGPGGPRVYALESADRPYRTLIESMQQGALVLSTDGIILYGNAQFADLVGIARDRLAGSALSTFVPPADGDTLTTLMARARETPMQGELRLQRHDGGTVPVHLSVNALTLDATLTFSAVVSDLTQQKHVEALRQAQRELTDADRKKDEFLATLAHELRNPLVPLRNGLHILQLAGHDAASVEQARGMMARQIKHMVRLVDELLDISRITVGKVELRRERVALGAVLHSAIEAARPLVEAAGHELTVLLPEATIWIDGDFMRLSQVIVNLLDNAAKYTRKGGQVELRVDRIENEVIIRVRDTGVGIAADDLPRVFDQFVRIERSRSLSPEGLGLGLSISRRLVEMHGGSIEGRSGGVGQGSEFVIRFPVAAAPGRKAGSDGSRPPLRAEARRIDQSSQPSDRPRILVADDNVDAAHSLAMVLEMGGYEVRTAYTGSEAMEQVQWFRPTVALLDLSMPVLDGFELCRRIREQPWGKDMILVALTGWGQPSHRMATAEAGFDHHVMKPVDPGRLLELLASLAAA